MHRNIDFPCVHSRWSWTEQVELDGVVRNLLRFRRPRGMTELDVNCKNHVAHVVGFVFGAARNGCEPRRPRGIADED